MCARARVHVCVFVCLRVISHARNTHSTHHSAHNRQRFPPCCYYLYPATGDGVGVGSGVKVTESATETWCSVDSTVSVDSTAVQIFRRASQLLHDTAHASTHSVTWRHEIFITMEFDDG